MFDDIAHGARLGLVGGAGRTIPLASEFLDKELQRITRQAPTSRRYADKLVKVWRRSDEETRVLVRGG